MAEAGYPGGEYRPVERVLRRGQHAARDRQEARRRELRRALADAGVREKLKAMAVNPGGGPGEEFRKRIEGDIKMFADVVKAANLKFED